MRFTLSQGWSAMGSTCRLMPRVRSSETDGRDAEQLSADEKQIINFVAEKGQINVSDANRLLHRDWQTARGLLQGLAARQILLRRAKSSKPRDPRRTTSLGERLPTTRNAGKRPYSTLSATVTVQADYLGGFPYAASSRP